MPKSYPNLDVVSKEEMGTDLRLHLLNTHPTVLIRRSATIEMQRVTAIEESWEDRSVGVDAGTLCRQQYTPGTWNPRGCLSVLEQTPGAIRFDLVTYGPGDIWITTWTIQCASSRVVRRLGFGGPRSSLEWAAGQWIILVSLFFAFMYLVVWVSARFHLVVS